MARRRLVPDELSVWSVEALKMDGWMEDGEYWKEKSRSSQRNARATGPSRFAPFGRKEPYIFLHRNLEANVTLLLRGKYSEAKENCDNI